MRTICLLAQKGGTGKTTLCLHLAVLASELGRNAAVIDIDPNTLNVNSQGNWITCYISLPEDYHVNDVDPNSIFFLKMLQWIH